MRAELARAGFVIENEWYWRISEGATTLDAALAVRDFVTPLARHARSRVAIDDVVAHDLRKLTFRIGELAVPIELVAAPDRVALNAMVADINRAFAAAKLHIAFALIVPNRFELRGVVLGDDELAALAGDPLVLIPSTRASWRAF